MPFGIGTTELIIILVIVVLLFGVGRISKIAGELGKGARAFKEGLGGDKSETAEVKQDDDKGNDDKGNDDKGNIEPK